ncbi:MAG TPA: hypothetical protein ENJ51_06455 [Leucothrix mucor]|uniref:Uncharacterized protein n=1 Tax=Leucothrix mucor TaxID=45248 RepID=A0A7V2WUS3_LEUMU|nr:hypothetical protein [Leucothrix mucor]
MKNNTQKVLLATVFSLIVASSVSASEEDYDLAGYDAPAVSVVHEGSAEPLYDGSEADLFTYNSTTYSPVKFHKTSASANSLYENGIDPLYSMTNQ